MSKLPRKKLFIVSGIGIIIVLSALGWHLSHKPAATAEPSPTNVTIFTLSPTAIPLMVSTYGQTVSPVSVILKAQAVGVISGKYFVNGQQVHQGQILFTLQSNDTSAALDQLAAQLELSKQTYERDQAMVKANPDALSQIDLLTAKSQYEQSLAQYQEAKAIHTIVSPIDGSISDTDLSVGDFVNSGDLLATVIDNTHLQIKYQLPGRYVDLAKVGQAVTFYPLDGNQSYTGTVSYVSPYFSADDYSLTLRADITTPGLKLNAFGRVVETLDPNYQTLAVPQALVQSDSQGFYVYVLSNNKVQQQYFTAGEVTASGLIEVKSGLSAGTEIISSNLNSLSVGQTVVVTQS